MSISMFLTRVWDMLRSIASGDDVDDYTPLPARTTRATFEMPNGETFICENVTVLEFKGPSGLAAVGSQYRSGYYRTSGEVRMEFEGAVTVARIPAEITSLQFGRSPESRDIRRVLLAAIMKSEDECLILKEDDLRSADSYTLVVNHIPEEQAIVLTARVK